MNKSSANEASIKEIRTFDPLADAPTMDEFHITSAYANGKPWGSILVVHEEKEGYSVTMLSATGQLVDDGLSWGQFASKEEAHSCLIHVLFNALATQATFGKARIEMVSDSFVR